MSKLPVLAGLSALFACMCTTHEARASGCPGSPNQSQGPDVVIADVTGPGNYLDGENGEALTFGSDACNLGNQEINWYACPATTHPVFGGNLYKWSTVDGATRFEQVGQSWLKHGFGADQNSTCCSNCQPGPFQRLGLGCSDAYVASQAGQQISLSPKYLVNAHTGIYPPGMCNIHASGSNTGRLEVALSDLTQTAGGAGATVRYFGQMQYVTADDAAAHNQNNNASCREVAVSGVGGVWNFGFTAGAGTQPGMPAVRMWPVIDPGVVETDVNTPEDDGFPGLVILDAKATNLGNGYWHYEYAINNLNSDRSIGALSVPCGMYASVQNVGFRDVDYHGGDGLGGVNYDGTDWTATVANGSITWATTPFASNNNANAIRWGTLYNFRFDTNMAPAASGNVSLQEFKVVTNLSVPSVVPSAVSCMKGDLTGEGVVDGSDVALFASALIAGNATPAQACAGDVQLVPDGAIDEPDVVPFVDCLLNGGCL